MVLEPVQDIMAFGPISGSSTAEGRRSQSTLTTTDVLIVGTGPAGAALACFLASYGTWRSSG